MIGQSQETRALQVEFASSILPVAWRYTTICVWLTPSLTHSHIWLHVIVFWGPVALHGLVHFLNTTAPLLANIVYACLRLFWPYLIYIHNPCTYVYLYIYTIYKHIGSIHQWFHGDSQSPWRHRSATPCDPHGLNEATASASKLTMDFMDHNSSIDLVSRLSPIFFWEFWGTSFRGFVENFPSGFSYWTSHERFSFKETYPGDFLRDLRLCWGPFIGFLFRDVPTFLQGNFPQNIHFGNLSLAAAAEQNPFGTRVVLRLQSFTAPYLRRS